MDTTLIFSAFILASCVVVLVGVFVGGRSERFEERLASLNSQSMAVPSAHQSGMMDQLANRVMPRLAVPLIPKDAAEQDQLKTKLVQAGFYGENASHVFLGIKMLLTAVPFILGVLAGSFALVPTRTGIMYGAVIGAVGLVGSSQWLGMRKRTRQIEMRRSLPNALDLVVVCVDGGLSLAAALMRVGKELRLAHPLLSRELRIVTRASEMGLSLTEALSQFAARFDLEELRFLSTIVGETAKYGTSVSKSLRVHAETLRAQRQQRAEENARKAAVKMLFPTVVFIFPVIFLVVLAPSMIRIAEVLQRITGRL